MNELCIFIADQKLGNRKQKIKYDKQTVVQLLCKEKQVKGSKRRTFSTVKPS